MVASLEQFIGKINPKDYAENGKELIVEHGSQDKIPLEKVKPKSLSEHSLVYDSSSETLEPIYFFILDLMNDFGLGAEKFIDNFTSSPGSGHFAELGQRATIMQQQGTKLLGDLNTVLRSILNLIYDLKEFRIRLQQYDDLKTEKKDAALLALKQIFLDKVDINKGNSSIKAMALGQAGFQTLMDAFLFAKDVKSVDGIDLNDRVKRILRPRVLEFEHWLKSSESELRKRYELEKTYLKSQVNSLKLYSRWAKPYLKAAQKLEMEEKGREPALVKTFNTILLELTLLGKRKIKPREEALQGNLPKDFEKIKTKDYYACVLVSFKFRGIPQRVQQQSHYAFGGRAEISFKSYVLNEDEVKKLEEDFEDSDVMDALKLIDGITKDSLDQMKDDIDHYLNEESQEETKESKNKDSSNPFKALFGAYNENKKEETKEPKETQPQKTIIRPETFAEKEYLRKLTEETAKETTFSLFDIYKKAHGMPSYT